MPPKNLKFRIYVKKDRPKKNVARSPQQGQAFHSQAVQAVQGVQAAHAAHVAQRVSARLPKAISRSTLDPFVRPALDLSVPDEHLLHLCKLALSCSVMRADRLQTCPPFPTSSMGRVPVPLQMSSGKARWA